jgi:hypothetical protein
MSGMICGGQNGGGVGFLRVLRFPLPIFIPPIAPQSPSSIIWGCTIGHVSPTPIIIIIIICLEWSQRAQNEMQWQAVNEHGNKLPIPYKAGNFVTVKLAMSFSRRTLLYGAR